MQDGARISAMCARFLSTAGFGLLAEKKAPSQRFGGLLFEP